MLHFDTKKFIPSRALTKEKDAGRQDVTATLCSPHEPDCISIHGHQSSSFFGTAHSTKSNNRNKNSSSHVFVK
jgi:hypothetical protein